jgi:hypothetical protein
MTVVTLPVITTQEYSPAQVLDAVAAELPSLVVVLYIDKDGYLEIASSSNRTERVGNLLQRGLYRYNQIIDAYEYDEMEDGGHAS